MLRPDFAKWDQSAQEMLRLSIEAEHLRTRERCLALYMIGTGQTNATQWARKIGRQAMTVQRWVRRYNEAGMAGILYQQTGGRSPLFCPEIDEQIAETVRTTEPVDHDLPGHSWTVPKLVAYVERLLGHRPSRTRLRTLLKRQGLSWKKCRKLLRKANPEKRQAFIEEFQAVFAEVCRQEMILLYIDEVHLHRDLDLGYTWAPTGEPAYRASDCAPLSDRLNWYGVYNFTEGQCFIWNEGNCNQDHTIAFLERIAEWLGHPACPVVIIWDGAPWHRALRVQQTAQALGFRLLPLPGYSPDLNPIEGLWKWLREEVTHNHCYQTMRELFDACQAFIDRINLDPDALIQRLWPKFELDPVFEELLIS